MKTLIPIFALALGACATTDITTGIMSINERTVVISGRGTQYHSMSSVEKDILRAAAEATISHGFTYFAVVGVQNASQSKSYISFYDRLLVSGAILDSDYASAAALQRGGRYAVSLPGADVTIRFFNESELTEDEKPYFTMLR